MSVFADKLKAILGLRRQDYALTFSGVRGERVLADLARFCRAGRSCFHPDPRVHAVLEGRREVWLRIRKYINLTDAQIEQMVEKEGADA